ncbi:MAG: ABC transporter ATP-binding protein [Intrasporangiaceae bacterium]|nr:ABC transporter ATP-binding protein [Intrasporangiaceae bacterium]
MRVTAEGVSKVIGPTTLLAPVSLVVESTGCAVVRGVNGSGKTTLLRILAGLTEPTTGTATISVDGRASIPVDERDRTTRAAVAALLGAPTAYRDLTLADHLTLIDASWGRDSDTCPDRVDAGLDLLEIGHLEARFPHELSSGQSQLFRLALTLFRPSRLLILDEPEQRLDTGKRAMLGRLLRERAGSGTTIIMASHDPALTEAVADQVIDLVPAENE